MTLRHLKKIIINAELLADNVDNIHEQNGFLFAYLGGSIMVDGEIIYMRIAIKKRVTSNYFWIHNIDENKKVLNYSTHREDGIKRDSELLTN